MKNLGHHYFLKMSSCGQSLEDLGMKGFFIISFTSHWNPDGFTVFIVQDKISYIFVGSNFKQNCFVFSCFIAFNSNVTLLKYNKHLCTTTDRTWDFIVLFSSSLNLRFKKIMKKQSRAKKLDTQGSSVLSDATWSGQSAYFLWSW